jgi:hypothetical protein
MACSVPACPTDIRHECNKRAVDLTSAIPTISFGVKDPSGNDVTDVVVTMDGRPLASQLDGTALSIDPGPHHFTFEISGKRTITRDFLLREGEKNRRETIALAPEQPESAAPAEQPRQPSAAPTNPEPRGMATQRTVALVAGGVGVVGLGIGTAFGLVSMSKHSSATAVCPGSSCPGSNGVDLWSQARSAGNVSTIAFVVGGVALAGGLVLWFTAKPESSSPSVGIGPGTLLLREAW